MVFGCKFDLLWDHGERACLWASLVFRRSFQAKLRRCGFRARVTDAEGRLVVPTFVSFCLVGTAQLRPLFGTLGQCYISWAVSLGMLRDCSGRFHSRC